MTSECYHQLEARFAALVDEFSGLLSEDTTTNVRHYLDHAELEMALEGFCLDLMAQGIDLSRSTKDELVALVVALGLDRECLRR